MHEALGFGFNQTNPAATELSSPSSAETLPRSSYEAEKFTESPPLHKTSKKQEDTSDSKPQSDEGQPQQASTNPESNTGSDSALGISQMNRNCVPNFGVLSIIFSQGPFSKIPG